MILRLEGGLYFSDLSYLSSNNVPDGFTKIISIVPCNNKNEFFRLYIKKNIVILGQNYKLVY
jgi:hypothetical protein